MIHRQIPPAQIEIEETVTRELFSIGGREHFDFVFELTLERIPPRIARAELNAKRAAFLLFAEIDGDFRLLALVPKQRRGRRCPSGIGRAHDAIGQTLAVGIARAPLRVRRNRNGVALSKCEVLSISRPARDKFFAAHVFAV